MLFHPEPNPQKHSTNDELALLQDDDSRKHVLFNMKGYLFCALEHNLLFPIAVFDNACIPSNDGSRKATLRSGQCLVHPNLEAMAREFVYPVAIIPKDILTPWKLFTSALIIFSCKVIQKTYKCGCPCCQTHLPKDQI